MRVTSLWRQIALLCAGLSLPILLFVGTVVWQYASSEQARLRDETLNTARSMALAVDRELAGLLAASNVISLSPYLNADDLARFHGQVSELLEIEGMSAVLRSADGQQLVNPHIPFGEPLPSLNLLVDEQVIVTKQPGVSDLYTGAVTGTPSFSIVTPILRGGNVRYLLSLSLPAERIRQVITEQRAPDTWTIAVVDRSGTILARNLMHQRFVGTPATPDLQANTLGREGTWNGLTADGKKVYAAYARSQISDWRAAVGVRESDLAAPLIRSLWLLAALGAGTVLLSALLAWLFGQQIMAAVQSIRNQAAALVQGAPLDPVVTPLREIAEVGASLAEAASVLRAREEALKRETRALAIVNETGAAIAAEHKIDRIVQRVTDAGRELTGAQFGAFFYNVVNETGESLLLYALSGADRSAFSSYPNPRATEVFGPTFHGEGVVRSENILLDPRYGKNAPFSGMPEGHLPVRSYLAVPVVSRSGEVLGGLFYGHGKPGIFQVEHEALLAGIAGHAATAIDNARLFQANERELADRRRAEAALQDLNATLEHRVERVLAQRAEAEEALRQAQKMEMIGQLTGGIAHDFNNLLMAVLGNLDLLRKHLPDHPRPLRLLEGAQEGAKRGASLTQRLLAFARRQELSLAVADLSDLVRGMMHLIESTIGSTIELQVDLPDEPARAELDVNQLELALLNLVVNARDAMPKGGALTIRVDPAAPSEEMGQVVRLTVTDTGHGMDKATLEKAAEPFFSTKGVGKGTGLGLSMIHGLVQQLGGEFRLSSVVGSGTVAELLFPATTKDIPAAAEPEATVASSHASTPLRILMVDDDALIAMSSVDMLEDLGHEVVEANSGEAALRILADGEQIDLMITDFSMPRMNGAQLAKAALELRPNLPIILATGYAELPPGSEMNLPRLGKPYDQRQMAHQIETLKRPG